MAENSKIEWCDHTFNPWVGCTKVSPACDHCYAEGWAKRAGQAELWNGERRRTSASNWAQPLKWDRKAAEAGERKRVFCASLADVFDNQADPLWRADLFLLIKATPNLDWLLLTKRPQNICKMLPLADWGDGYPNVWLGTTVENQLEAARRIPFLINTPARIHFLSCEPLLGPIDFRWANEYGDEWGNYLTGERHVIDPTPDAGPSGPSLSHLQGRGIDWVIAGGESGGGARPMHPDWARKLRDQCAAAGVPFLFKQWGEWAPNCLCGTPRGHSTTPRPEPGSPGCMFRCGKARAGRELLGQIHDGAPA